MTTIDCDDLEDMLTRYEEHSRQEQQGWFSRHPYQCPIDGGAIIFRAVEVSGEPGGPYEYHWRVSAHVGATMVDRRYELGEFFPTIEEVRAAVEVVTGMLAPARDDAAQRLLDQLRETRKSRDEANARLRQLVRHALDTAVPKSRIADATGLSRVTIDAWSRDR